MRRLIQPELVERLIADVSGHAGDLPLLQFALAELWKRDEDKGLLTLQTYWQLGYTSPEGHRFPGVQGALAQWAEDVWAEFTSKQEEEAAERVVLALVSPGLRDDRGILVGSDASRRAWQNELDDTASLLYLK